MDWNWFYSAVAQSCAAIVGIVGAFVFTKVIDNQSRFLERRKEFKQLLAASIRLSDEASIRKFAWVSRKNNSSCLRDLADDIKKHDEVRSATEYYDEYGFYPFVQRAEILAKIEAAIAHEVNRRNAAHKPKNPLGFDLGMTASSISLPFVPENWDAINAEDELIDRYLVELKDHVRRLRGFVAESRRAPERSSLVSWVLILGVLLFFCGVIYPLSFLPVAADAEMVLAAQYFWEILFSLKGLILLIVSVIFVAILGVLFVSNLRLRIAKNELDQLIPFLEVRGYGESLQILEDNVGRFEPDETI